MANQLFFTPNIPILSALNVLLIYANMLYFVYVSIMDLLDNNYISKLKKEWKIAVFAQQIQQTYSLERCQVIRALLTK